MTPAARLSAAIEVLDRILSGAAPEQALTNWGRANRFAGSGDRYAIRDMVFEALRCKRSYAALGGGLTGRGLVLGGVRAAGRDEAALFTGEGHAPAVVADEPGRQPEGDEALDVPDWLVPRLKASLGADYAPIMAAMRRRAPVFLRVNTARYSPEDAMRSLAVEDISTKPVDWVHTALEVTENARKIQNSRAFQSGVVELQDASSQAVVAALPLRKGMRVLDYCAGGGGKTLALAARGAKVDAHDAVRRRMDGLPERAKRAGAVVNIVDIPVKTAPYDMILMDVPCSGSGSWRRDAQGKWSLTEAKLAETLALQSEIMERCLPLVTKDGVLAYATCSLLADENEAQVAAFVARHPEWRITDERRFTPLTGGDGFFLALLRR